MRFICALVIFTPTAHAAHPEAELTIILARIWAVLAPEWGLTDAARPQDSFGPSFSSNGATATHFTTETVVCVQPLPARELQEARRSPL